MGVKITLKTDLEPTSNTGDVQITDGKQKASWTVVQGSHPLRTESVLAAKAWGTFSLASLAHRAKMRLKCLTGSSQLAMRPHGWSSPGVPLLAQQSALQLSAPEPGLTWHAAMKLHTFQMVFMHLMCCRLTFFPLG